MFRCALPAIPGFEFTGDLSNAAVMALAFSTIYWLLDKAAAATATLLSIATLGLALLILVPLWIVGFWVVPAVALKLVASVMPNNLHISGWYPAIIGSLLMVFVNIILGALTKRKK
jgi:uncharacterized membrane protein YvlD (DUF360 family)